MKELRFIYWNGDREYSENGKRTLYREGVKIAEGEAILSYIDGSFGYRDQNGKHYVDSDIKTKKKFIKKRLNYLLEKDLRPALFNEFKEIVIKHKMFKIKDNRIEKIEEILKDYDLSDKNLTLRKLKLKLKNYEKRLHSSSEKQEKKG